MDDAAFTITELGADWRTLRAMRHRALTDSPGDFYATWESESRHSPGEWQEFARKVAWFVGRGPDGSHIGIAGLVVRAESPDVGEVIGMWVEPAWRGRGVAGTLLRSCEAWAARHGVRTTTLWVVDGNERARAIYLRHGFEWTGEEAPLPFGRAGRESRMAKSSGS